MLAGDDVHTRLAGLLAERAEGYARFTAVATDGREPTDVVAEIVEFVRA
jgi:hypothetical protein